MEIIIPRNISIVLERLEAKGFDAFIVGGCVRDSILGIAPSDYDVTTNASPEQVISCFDGFRVIETGLKHGTVTVVSDGSNVEITTYRIDGEYLDHRKPEAVTFTTSLDDDLSRRDFTINAMAYSPKTGLVDKFGGQRDLWEKCIRCVGDPQKRFNEDALRILRALRFSAVLDFSVDPQTAAAVHENKGLLADISAERIRNELTKLICGASPARVMLEYADVFSFIIPEAAPCIGFNQHSKYHVYDVWEHTAYAVELSTNDPVVRLALLFHDIEKPSCYITDENGNGHFPGHQEKSAHTAESIMKRLRLDNATVAQVVKLIGCHDLTPVSERCLVRKIISELGFDTLSRLCNVMRGDNLAKKSGSSHRIEQIDAMESIALDIMKNNECCTLMQLDIDGGDLIAMGFKGKAVGDVLNRLLEMVMEEKIPNRRSTLLEAAKGFGI
ncbi:MAG: HD domain-containing protein [Oscillospiraceae bacterium]|nr:HD domain-containing protein [Oscillospiraceae bacterium]